MASTLNSLSVFLAAVVGACGKVLDEADPLRDLDLLLLGELTGGPRHVWGRIVELGRRRVALLAKQILGYSIEM